MTSEQFEWRIFFRILVLFLTLCLAAYILIASNPIYLIVVVPLLIFQLVSLFQLQVRTQRELLHFVEAIKYGDFTVNFSAKTKSSELSILREGFNAINGAFRNLAREKETQYQYLQNILELANTGILCFNSEDGSVMWMNESVKKMLNVPYLRTIHSYEKRDKVLYADIISIKAGESKMSVINDQTSSYKILLSATTFITDGQTFSLLAFQNINEAIDKTESVAWQKLLSVLTHEIMNSIAPISSLAQTLNTRLKELHADNFDNAVLSDLQVGIATIKRRSEGLLKFAETYRYLNKIKTPALQKLYASDLFENLNTLMEPTLREKNIELDIILKDPSLSFMADPSLMEQVLINLLVNAIDAVKDQPQPRIAVTGHQQLDGITVIRVSDNGGGISDELRDKIFVPFFSTKKNGSGIGLALCKQIMLLHHGTIEARQITEGHGDFVLTL